MPPLYALTTPAQHPVISLVDNSGNPFDYKPDQVSTGQSTLLRKEITTQATPTGSQNLRLTYFTSSKTETVTKVRIVSGTTAAAATPTIVRLGLYTIAADGALTLVASTPNDTTLLAAAGTQYTKSFSASYAISTNTRYAVGLLVVTAVAAPTIMGQTTIVASEAAESPRLSGLVTGQADLPASVAAASIVTSASLLYVVVSP